MKNKDPLFIWRSGTRYLYDLQWLDLTHWGWVTHMCVDKLNQHWFRYNGLSPGRHQAIIRTGILLIWPLETNFSKILTEVQIFSFKKCIWNYRLENDNHFCLGLNVLKTGHQNSSPNNYHPGHIPRTQQFTSLTHCGLVTPYGDRDLGQHWLR